MPEAIEWRIHLGAHKTGTTNIQDFFENQKSRLQAQGLDYLTRKTLRDQNVLKILKKYAKSYFSLARLRGWDLSRATALLRSGAETVLLSEENLLGASSDIFNAPMYPNLEENLSFLEKSLAGHKVSLFLSIRKYSGLLVSAYAQAIRDGNVMGEIEDYRQMFLAEHRPNWGEVIVRIRKTLPQARLHVWDMEHYARDSLGVLEMIAGVPLERQDITISRKTRTPSAASIAEARALDPTLPKEVRRARAAAIFDADAYAEKYAPFTAAQIEALDALYQEDVLALKRTAPDLFFDDTAPAGATGRGDDTASPRPAVFPAQRQA